MTVMKKTRYKEVHYFFIRVFVVYTYLNTRLYPFWRELNSPVLNQGQAQGRPFEDHFSGLHRAQLVVFCIKVDVKNAAVVVLKSLLYFLY